MGVRGGSIAPSWPVHHPREVPVALIDSGPLYALFDRDDAHHHQAVEAVKTFTGALVTNTAVLHEVHELLSFSSYGQQRFLQWATTGALRIEPIVTDDLQRLRELTERYADVPMAFADGALVAQAERLNITRILSIDSDFSIYRLKRNTPFVNLMQTGKTARSKAAQLGKSSAVRRMHP
jgi:uncharacterized protein